MNIGTKVRHGAAVLVLAAFGALAGPTACASADPTTEPVGEATEALCSAVSAACTITDSGTCTSGSSYGTYECQHYYVVDITPLSVRNPSATPAGVFQEYGDAVPTTQSDCTGSEVCSSLYNWNGSGWVYNSQRCANGVWLGAPWGCEVAAVDWLEYDGSTIQGDNYRFASFAKDSSGNYKKVVVYTADGAG